MKAIDYVLIAVIAAVFILAVVFAVKKRRSGSCCGDCSRCTSCPNGGRAGGESPITVRGGRAPTGNTRPGIK